MTREQVQGEKPKTINATVRMEPQDWKALQVKAKALGMTRTQFLTQIARAEIQLEKMMLGAEKELLGKFCAS